MTMIPNSTNVVNGRIVPVHSSIVAVLRIIALSFKLASRFQSIHRLQNDASAAAIVLRRIINKIADSGESHRPCQNRRMA